MLSHYPVCWGLAGVTDTLNTGNQDLQSVLHDGFVRTYDALTKAGKEIYVVLNSPLYRRENWEKCKSSSVRRPVSIPSFLTLKNDSVCSVKQSDLAGSGFNDNWNKTAMEYANGYRNIHFIDLEHVFCKNDSCSMLDSDGNILFKDEHHLNIKGSLYAAQYIFNKLLE